MTPLTGNEYQKPEPVCDVLTLKLATLEYGKVASCGLAIGNRVSKRVEEYTQQTMNVTALERVALYGLAVIPMLFHVNRLSLLSLSSSRILEHH